MSLEKKIIVLAGNREQFRHWLRQNIIPITNKEDLRKLYGIKIDQVYYQGNWLDWADAEFEDALGRFVEKSKLKG
ncbi:hypothetical protein LCGC14_1118040 [marine sediment metagenome]|uniref:Uncharacterized protein n=1 Tax=marine sediment metagenome TaxID=412755 RepID=A0A0F9MSP1_9ZZZZ